MPVGHQPVSARERTREDLFDLIVRTPDVTRASLARLTGLSSSTVGHAVARLLADGRIVESEAVTDGRRAGVGRPASYLRAAPVSGHVGALDFGHSHIRIAIGDTFGNPIAESDLQIDVDLRAREALDRACEEFERLRTTHQVGTITSVVAGIPGPVDSGTGQVCSASILSSWAGLAPADELSGRLGVPVRIENDSSLGAFGELTRGAGRDHQDFLFVKCSHGTGAGLVLGGQLYRGATGLAGEIGHTQLPGRSELCRCGNRGCLEAVINVQALEEEMSHTHPHLSRDRVRLGLLHDAATSRLLEGAGRTLGKVLADLANLLNPTALIVGGRIGSLEPAFLDGIRESLDRYAQPATAAAITVKPAELGNRAELVGALQLASQLARRAP